MTYQRRLQVNRGIKKLLNLLFKLLENIHNGVFCVLKRFVPMEFKWKLWKMYINWMDGWWKDG